MVIYLFQLIAVDLVGVLHFRVLRGSVQLNLQLISVLSVFVL